MLAQQESLYQEKVDLIPITVIEKEWKITSPRDLAQQIFPPSFQYIPHDPKKTRTFMSSSW